MSKQENATQEAEVSQAVMIALNVDRAIRRSKEEIDAGAEELRLVVKADIDTSSINTSDIVKQYLESQAYQYGIKGGAIEDEAFTEQSDFITFVNNSLVSSRFGVDNKKAGAQAVYDALVDAGHDEAQAKAVFEILAAATLTKVKATDDDLNSRLVELLTAVGETQYATIYQGWIDKEEDAATAIDLSALTL